MSFSRKGGNKKKPSTDDDELITAEDLAPKVHMLELYTVSKNRPVKRLINDHDYRSVIDLSRQNLIDRDMATILKYAVLEKKCKGLNLWGNQFKSESISILANVLNGNKTLRELDLSYNHLKDDGVRIICEVLASNTCAIKELDLSSNQITDEGVKYIARMLTKNDKLKFLILNNNEITNDGLLLLAGALTNNENTKLEELKLESNVLITRTGVVATLDLLKDNKVFGELYVKDCGIFDADWEILENMAFKTGFDVIVRNKRPKNDSS